LNKVKCVFESVLVTDSCYYVKGIFTDTPATSLGRSCFLRLEFDGEVSFMTEVSNDTVDMGIYPSRTLIPTFDNGFASLANYEKDFLFIKYDGSGDTIFTTRIEIDTPANHVANRHLTVLEESDDSSFTCLGQIQNSLDLSLRAAVFNISKDGVLNWYKAITTALPGYPWFFVQNLTRKDGSGYYISGCYKNYEDFFDAENLRYHVGIIEVDNSMNIVSTDKYLGNDYNVWGRGFTQTIDGGFIYGGSYGYFDADPWGGGTILYKPHIIKLNSDFALEWEIIYHEEIWEEWGSYDIQLYEILTISDSTFVAVGCGLSDVGTTAGWLLKFNNSGDIIWESKFTKIPWVVSENAPDHQLYDVKKTPDNGFIMVGQAINFESTYEPLGQHGWVVKTDSFGCLVPNCQDVLALNPLEFPIVVKTYPNPASDILNIFYHDANFNPGAEISVVDLNGKELKRFPISGNDMTYMLEVAQLATGTYLLQVWENGSVVLTEKFVKE
jgi:hypothetical protein